MVAWALLAIIVGIVRLRRRSISVLIPSNTKWYRAAKADATPPPLLDSPNRVFHRNLNHQLRKNPTWAGKSAPNRFGIDPRHAEL
jgi:hypothetical protein